MLGFEVHHCFSSRPHLPLFLPRGQMQGGYQRRCIPGKHSYPIVGNFARLCLGGCQPGLLPLSPDLSFSRSRGVTLALQLTAFPALSCPFPVSFHTGISNNVSFSHLIPSWCLLLRRPHLQLVVLGVL